MSLVENQTVTSADQARLDEVRALAHHGAEGVDQLIDLLHEPSWVVRRAVVNTLASIGEPAVGPLCQSLVTQRDNEARIAAAVDSLVASRAQVEPYVVPLAEHPDPAIVADVAQILGRRRSQASIPVIVRLTRHADDNVAVTAIEALGRIGGRAAVEALIETVGSGNFFRTFPAIDVMGRSGDPRVVEPLAKLLTNINYLPEAARALGRTGERAAVKPLINLLSSSSDAVVRVAARSLSDLRERFEEKSGSSPSVIDDLIQGQVADESVRRLLRAIQDADSPESTAVCRLLGVIGSAEAAPRLVAMLDGSAIIAACAAESLKKIGKGAEEPLLMAIRDGSSARRKILLPVVSRASAAADVVACLSDPDAEVRALACDTLSRLANAAFVDRIFPLLSDPNLRVVHSATSAIQTLGTRKARDLSVEASRSESPVVRRSALRILAYFGDDASLQPMLDGLQDADPRVREAALQGLPYLEDHRAIEALFEATKSPIARTRALAMRSFGQVPGANERVHSTLLKGLRDADPWVRYYSVQSLGRLTYTPAAAEIAKLLHDEAGQVRASAVEALSHLRSPEAHAALRQAAGSEDQEVRRAALVGLGIGHRSEDLPLVIAALSDVDVPTRLMALSALANFNSPQVLGAMSMAASDVDEQVSSTAIGFIAARAEEEATEVLVELLSSERFRENAKTALLVPNEGRVAGLMVALESANDELAPLLVSILSRLEHPEARVALLSAMKSTNAPARKAAAAVLAARRDPEMIAELQEASEIDPDPEVRQICTLLLRE